MTILIEAANNFGDNAQEGASAGPMALAVIALLGVVTVLLWRNMTARIKRLPASFPDQRPQAQRDRPTQKAEQAVKAQQVRSTDTEAGTTADEDVSRP